MASGTKGPNLLVFPLVALTNFLSPADRHRLNVLFVDPPLVVIGWALMTRIELALSRDI